MNRIIPITLWILVLICGGVVFFLSMWGTEQGQSGLVFIDDSGKVTESQSGIAFANVPWERLQSIPDFQFQNQKDELFDSAELENRPIVVNFFFATCPTICRDLNRQVQKIREQLNDPEMMFATISVNPEEDTPEVLGKYSGDFGADASDWNFLTGPMYKVKELGAHAFSVSIDKFTHTDNILLVDRWGKYRDRFLWNDEDDMKRFLKVAKDVLAESKPPFGKTIYTRNVLAGVKPVDVDSVPWVREFHLTDQESEPFFSRDLTGSVWVASFFFAACPGICIEQNQYLAGLQERIEQPVQFVSITTDANSDTPAKLKEYGRKLDADFDRWRFLTGDEQLIERIGAEFFGAFSSGGHHSSLLFVVDRWGNVRGQFDWREPAAELELVDLIEKLNAEKFPPGRFERIKFQKTPDLDTNDQGH